MFRILRATAFAAPRIGPANRRALAFLRNKVTEHYLPYRRTFATYTVMIGGRSCESQKGISMGLEPSFEHGHLTGCGYYKLSIIKSSRGNLVSKYAYRSCSNFLKARDRIPNDQPI